MIHTPGPTKPIGLQLEELMRRHFGLDPSEPLKMILVCVREDSDVTDAVTVLRNLPDELALETLQSAVRQIEGPGRQNGLTYKPADQ